MYVRRLEELGFLDAFHPPTAFEAEPDKYKEWHHYVFNDRRSGTFGLVNFSTIGDPYDHRHAYSAVITLLVDKTGEWVGNFDTYTADMSSFSRLSPDLKVGRSGVAYADGKYFVTVRTPEEKVRLDLRFAPLSLPVTSEGLGLGRLSSIWSGWVGVPRMRVDGTVRRGKSVSRISDGVGYHDHNWGRIEWGEPVGWDAGIVLEDISLGGESLTLSFLVDRSGARDRFGSAAVFVRERRGVKRAFVGRQIRVKETGRYHFPVSRFPGVELLSHPDARLAVPRRYTISGADGGSDVEEGESVLLEFTPLRCCQIITSSQSGGITLWSEMLGEASIQSRLEGRNIRRRADAYMESVRAF